MAWFKKPKLVIKQNTLTANEFLGRYFKIIALCLGLTLFVVLPYSALWLYLSGDVGVERAVKTQAQGDFALFGSGVSQDFVDYKLQLYKAVKPDIVTIGSSRVMQFRGEFFSKPFLNMGGVAGNLAVLRSTLDAMLKIHKPEVLIIGLDFWWFMPIWDKDPFIEELPTSGSYTYSLDALKKPWEWLLTGKIGLQELCAPFLGLVDLGFRKDRFGIMAQQTDDGFGSDGSWYYTAEITGQKHPFDYQFIDTLKQVNYGIKAFYHIDPTVQAPSERHIDAFCEIFYRLQARGIKTYVFIAPLSMRVFMQMRELEPKYGHLFNLAQALKSRGLTVLDFSDPRKIGSNDCEFVDGFHGGEITYLRVLRNLTDQWSHLLAYVDLNMINKVIREWKGHALKYNPKLTASWEIDFNGFQCPKRQPK